ncbi:hypothetical protein SAMN02949497_3226 [Methylomagnum ishizawai]|uniref:Small secreted protein n=1 Tax=Methylomagnum ishizawai TaxID=1760988 RepID=A0A1Y6CZT2_9GAMM|nr:hypothetical protein [Methylomagnum ishizawai]SMF95851.1 hypothetical protein SAMN02949497_3226 [Methylomagnum ishizawai]
MKIKNLTKVLGAFVLTSIMSGSVFAAESAGGVAAAFDDLVKNATAAADSAKAGDKDGCLNGAKAAKQDYKQLTGAATGKAMQDTITKLSQGKDLCSEGKVAEAAPILAEVAATLAKLRSELK